MRHRGPALVAERPDGSRLSHPLQSDDYAEVERVASGLMLVVPPDVTWYGAMEDGE